MSKRRRRPLRRDLRKAKLLCNNCGHQFEGLAWFESVDSHGKGTIDMVRARGGAEGTCPECGSELLRVLD